MIPPAGKLPSILSPMPIDQPILAALGGTPDGNGPSIFVASASRCSVCGIGTGPETVSTAGPLDSHRGVGHFACRIG